MGGWLLQQNKRRKHSDSKDFMSDYLVSLLDDEQDFAWEATKPAMQCSYVSWSRGEIENHSQVDKDLLDMTGQFSKAHPSQ